MTAIASNDFIIINAATVSIGLGPDGSLVYRCELSCPIYFKTKEERRAHGMAVHKDQLQCTVCGKSFRNMSAKYACGRTHRNGPTQSVVCTKCGEYPNSERR